MKAHDISYDFIDCRETPVSLATVETWLENTDINTLFNTRGTTYRTLKLKDQHLSDEEKVTWLAKENMLIKRPVISFEKTIIVGYNETEYLDKLSDKA